MELTPSSSACGAVASGDTAKVQLFLPGRGKDLVLKALEKQGVMGTCHSPQKVLPETR